MDYIVRVFHEFLCQLRDMHKTVLMDAYVYKSSEVGDVGDDTWKYHAFHEIINLLDVGVKLEGFQLLTWIAAGFLQFLHDVGEGRDTNRVRYISADIHLLA